MNTIGVYPVRIQVDSLWMYIESTLQRVLCRHAFTVNRVLDLARTFVFTCMCMKCSTLRCLHMCGLECCNVVLCIKLVTVIEESIVGCYNHVLYVLS